MTEMNWVLIGVGLLILVLGVVFVIRKKRQPIDYYNLFIIGFVWTFFGLFSALKNYELTKLFVILGVVFITIGLVNKDKWKKDHKTWKKMNKKEKKFAIIILIVLLIFFIFGIASYFYMTNEKTIGGDKDEHGCLIGAGYQWCPSTEKCQRMWEEYCEEYSEQFQIEKYETALEVPEIDGEINIPNIEEDTSTDMFNN